MSGEPQNNSSSHGTKSSSGAGKKGARSSQPGKAKNGEQGAASGHNRGLTKKTNSSDNLIEYSAPKCTDALVREVQLALRYFEVNTPKISVYNPNLKFI